MAIIILYVILVISTCVLVCVGIAMYVRVRRLARATDTQFCQAVKDVPGFPGSDHTEPNRTRTETEVAR